MKCVALVVVLVGSTVSAAERFLDEDTEARFRAIVPKLADSVLRDRIADESQTFFYKSDRWWKETRSGSYRYTQYSYGRIGLPRIRRFPVFYSNTYFQRLTREKIDQQWLNAGGVANEPDVREAMFISLPKRDGKLGRGRPRHPGMDCGRARCWRERTRAVALRSRARGAEYAVPC